MKIVKNVLACIVTFLGVELTGLCLSVFFTLAAYFLYGDSLETYGEIFFNHGTGIVALFLAAALCEFVSIKLSNKICRSEKGIRFYVIGFIFIVYYLILAIGNIINKGQPMLVVVDFEVAIISILLIAEAVTTTKK